MNERITRLLVAGVLGVAAILAVSWFFQNFMLVSEERTGGYSELARRNPLLAAERLLRRLGVDAVGITSNELWQQMPGPRDTLVVYRYQPPVGAQRRTQLRQWIESGGHLIVEADPSLDKEARAHAKGGLLGELGVRRHTLDREESEDDDREPFSTIEMKFARVEKPLEVNLSNDAWLDDASEEASVRVPLNDEGYALLQYDVGEGLVTVVNDNSFLVNARIEEHDHALALALLVGVPHDGKVLLLHDVVTPSLLELGWEQLPYAIVAAVLALLLWVWYLGTRLGPLLPPTQAPRRDIGEHLAATANYLWRLDHARQLYQRNRERLLQAWLHKHYLLRNLSPAERCAWIAARSGLSARAVERALYGEFAGEADFVEMSSCLQVLRNSL